jgi:60 kDa SS-A/Ro ribonucleoprotein
MSFNVKQMFTRATPSEVVHTYEGGKGFIRTSQEELYLLVATTLFAGDSFYESNVTRLERFRKLVARVLEEKNGPQFVVSLAIYAREVLNLRTTPTLLTVEAFLHGVESAEKAAQYVWLRGDEHLEALAYTKIVGSKYTKRFLRAVAGRLSRLTERQALRYGGKGKAFSQRDALRLAHPKISSAKQNALFKFITAGLEALSSEELALLPTVAKVRGEGVALTWENLISSQGSSAETWEKAVPLMGYMALLRNLRNLVKHGVSRETLEGVAAKLRDPAEVRASKQMPYRFYSAYQALEKGTPALVFDALSEAMDIAAESVPQFSGSSLILVDLSPSMAAHLSDKSEVTRMQAASCLGAMLSRQADCEVWGFAVKSQQIKLPKNTPTLLGAEKIEQTSQVVGYGTELAKALKDSLTRHYDRVIVLTDEQAADNTWSVLQPYLERHAKIQVFMVNLAGYAVSAVDNEHPRVHSVGGFSDRLLEWIGALETENPVAKILAYGAAKA